MQKINVHLDQKITKKAHKLEKLTLTLKLHLPPECDGHFYVTNILRDTMVIITDSPAWTTRLRQLGPMILTAIKSQTGYQSIQHVRISSRRGPVPDTHPTPKIKRSISNQSRQHIAQVASSIEDDNLKNALFKIARLGPD